MATATATTTDAERVRAHDRAVFEAAAGRVVELPIGRMRVTDALPAHRDLNTTAVTAPWDPALLAGVETGQVEVPADVAAPPGWERDRLLHLCFAGPPPERPPAVEDVAREALRALRAEWLQARLPTVADTLLAGDERLFTATPTRGFAVRDEGRPVAMALVVGDGPVRMVEDVYTTPSHRGRGLASAVVRGAVASALADGAELVHLCADPDGGARRLYERVGFEPVGITTRLRRR